MAKNSATLPKYTFLDDEWLVDGDHFESPEQPKVSAETVIFNEPIKDGEVAADVTLVKSLENRWKGQPAAEANLVFRHGQNDRHYYAGLGAWGTKYHISKAIEGPVWMRLGSTGSAASLEDGRTYRLRVEFQGSRILLFENETMVVEAFDDDFARGRWGLHCWKTQAGFRPRPATKAPLRCFVAMPFAAGLDGVYGLIERTVESFENIKCVRADQLSVSRPIMEDVRSEIMGADLVVVDLTGKNPNVYYEAGMAAAWNKPWIVLAQSQEDVTFDVEQIRYIVYTNRMGGGPGLESQLATAIEATLGLERRRPPARRRNRSG